jgi:hypothetical protein
LQTKYHATKILQTETDSKFRDYKQFDEAVQQIISARTVLAEGQYIKRHEKVCGELHFNIWKEIGGKIYSKQRYDRVLKLV